MAVFISVATSAFSDQLKGTRPAATNIRRPLRGLQIKEDTYSVIRVIKSDGTSVPLFDSGGVDSGNGIGKSDAYANYIIQSLQEGRMEKQQIVETFGEDFIHFFGERPRFIDVSGFLINTADFNWKSEFWVNYDQYFRGTKLVELDAHAYLYFDDVVVKGYFVQAGTTQEVMSPYMLPFQFRMFLVDYSILSKVGSVFFQKNVTELTEKTPDGVTVNYATGIAEIQRQQATQAALTGAAGGQGGFLASTSQFLTNASTAIQGSLESIKNFLYGQRIGLPSEVLEEGGLAALIKAPLISNNAPRQSGPRNRPINEMTDEYVYKEAESGTAKYNQAEIKRVEAELSLQTPAALEAKARGDLQKLGVSTEKTSTAVLIAGRASFAAAQYAASFGLRKAGYALDIADQAANQFIFNDPLKGLPIING